jgi:hypothetical protein
MTDTREQAREPEDPARLLVARLNAAGIEGLIGQPALGG